MLLISSIIDINYMWYTGFVEAYEDLLLSTSHSMFFNLYLLPL